MAVRWKIMQVESLIIRALRRGHSGPKGEKRCGRVSRGGSDCFESGGRGRGPRAMGFFARSRKAEELTFSGASRRNIVLLMTIS